MSYTPLVKRENVDPEKETQSKKIGVNIWPLVTIMNHVLTETMNAPEFKDCFDQKDANGLSVNQRVRKRVSVKMNELGTNMALTQMDIKLEDADMGTLNNLFMRSEIVETKHKHAEQIRAILRHPDKTISDIGQAFLLFEKYKEIVIPEGLDYDWSEMDEGLKALFFNE